MIGEDLDGQRVGALLELVHHGVVQRVLVLLQPAGQVVRHLESRSGQVSAGQDGLGVNCPAQGCY